MKWFAIIAMLVMPPAFAGPFVVSDPLPASAVSCGVFLDAAAKTTIPVVPAAAPAVGNVCKFDVGAVSFGSHTIQMSAIYASDPAFGSGESAKSTPPLVFVRPGPFVAPSGLQLTP